MILAEHRDVAERVERFPRDALRVFDLIYVLTANSRDTMSMSVYARQQLVDFQEVGLGSAASTLIFLIIALLIVITMVLGRVRIGEDAAR